MADRYCRNCGHEIGPEDRFCTGCGSAVHDTAYVPAPEADVPVPPPVPPSQASIGPQQDSLGDARGTPWGPVFGMLAVVLVLGFVVTVQGLLSIAALILFIGGIYYVTARKNGVTFREAIFNWPLVIAAGAIASLYLLF